MSDMLSVVNAALAPAQPPAAVPGAAPPAPELRKMNEAEIPEARRNQVAELVKEIKADEKHWEHIYKRMRFNQKFVKGKNQWPNQARNDERMLVNITNRHINQQVAQIYAKNPTALVKRKDKIDFVHWDGSMETWEAAKQAVEQIPTAGPPDPMTGMPGPAIPPPPMTPGAAAIYQEVTEAADRRQQITKVGETARILLHYFMSEQEPSFKSGMKRLVRRAKVCKVGYIRLGFQRATSKNSDIDKPLKDHQARLDEIERLRAEAGDPQKAEYDAEKEKLDQMMNSLLARQEIVIREGLSFDFPNSTSIIPGRGCTQLDGFLGAERLSIKHVRTVDDIKRTYKLDIAGAFTKFQENPDGTLRQMDGADECKGQEKCVLYETYDKATGLKFLAIEGCPDFVDEPGEPEVDLERFFPVYAYQTNECEDEGDPFPLSDVEIIEHIQREYNRNREALRQHRIANRPLYLTARGKLTETTEEGAGDIQNMAKAKAHAILGLDGLNPGDDIEKVFKAAPKVEIDPNTYDVDGLFNDLLRTVGSQETEFGGSGKGATATGIAAADGAKLTAVQEDIDELDGLMSQVFRDATKVMFKEISAETAKRIAGPGAVWPELQSRQEIAEELYLDIQAGSSGRPNREQELANFERIGATLVQIPGINPSWLAKKVAMLLDPGVDLSEAVTDGLPSLQLLNGMKQPGTGDPATDPNAQGGMGANNAAPQPGGAEGAPNGTFPPPTQYDATGARAA